MAALHPVSSDPLELRRTFACFPSGVTAVCGLEQGGVPVGLAASSFISVSLDPPLVAICIQQTSTSWPRLRKLDHIGLSVLAQGQERECLSLSSKGADRFAAVDWSADAHGAVFVHGAAVWLDCSQYREVSAGDHMIVLLRINLAHTDSSVAAGLSREPVSPARGRDDLTRERRIVGLAQQLNPGGTFAECPSHFDASIGLSGIPTLQR